MHKAIGELLSWTWCLPQTSLGALMYTILKLRGDIIEEKQYKHALLVHTKDSKLMGGISLGKFCFVTDRRWNDGSQTIEHEYGHTLQSFILGPLYIPLVGIPSEFWLVLSHFSPHIKKTYRTRWPENWADRLGKVK